MDHNQARRQHTSLRLSADNDLEETARRQADGRGVFLLVREKEADNLLSTVEDRISSTD